MLKLKSHQMLTAEWLIWRRKECYKTEGECLLFAFRKKTQLGWVPKCLISSAKPACLGVWVQTSSEMNFCPPQGGAFRRDVAGFALPCGRAWGIDFSWTFLSFSTKVIRQQIKIWGSVLTFLWIFCIPSRKWIYCFQPWFLIFKLTRIPPLCPPYFYEYLFHNGCFSHLFAPRQSGEQFVLQQSC